MSRVLIAGLPARLASWLAQRLTGATVEVAWSVEDVPDHLRHGEWALLVLDAGVEGPAVETVVRRLREQPASARLPVFVALDGGSGEDPDRLHRLTGELGVERILLHPLDRGELARHAEAVLARQPRTVSRIETTPAPAPEPVAPLGPPPPIGAAPREQVAAALAEAWERARPAALERLDTIERAIVATVEGRLDGDVRRGAEAEAHRLAGALGTFGSHDGTRLARQIEGVFSGANPLTRPDGARLAKLAASLRSEVEALTAAPSDSVSTSIAIPAAPSTTPGTAQPRKDPRPLLVVAGMDAHAARALETEAAARGVRVRAASDVARARVAFAAEAPDAVLVDLAAADGDGSGDLVPELAGALPGVPVLALTARDSLPDRVRLLQHGVRLFLQKPASPADVLDALARVLPTGGAGPRRVLAVDDDPAVLDAVRALLEPHGFAVHALGDPLRFWGALEEARPDLLVLDVDMPHLDGIELCRVVRADHRWARLPVLFLTARTDRDTVLRVFAAGADDFVNKPVVGPELVARIRNRLDRASTSSTG